MSSSSSCHVTNPHHRPPWVISPDMRIFSLNSKTISFLVVCSFCAFQVRGLGGSFRTGIMTFENDRGLTSSGQKCSPPGIPNCRTYFRVCLSHYQAKINHSNCTFGSAFTPVYRNNSIILSTSTLMDTNVTFNFAWPGDFSLTIEAWNDMSSKQGDYPQADPRDELIYRHNNSYLNLIPSDDWWMNGSSNNFMRLNFKVKVTCEVNYYGNNCTVFCNSRNDDFGHYNCNLTDGTKICLDGWKNNVNYCMEAICKRCLNGDCKSPRNCSCHDGWTGAACDICIPSDTCDPIHGYCNEPRTCTCKEGWGGTDCKGDLQYCSHHVNTCENGGTCLNSSPGNFQCACAKGFTGLTCSERVISSPCAPLDCPCPLGSDCRCSGGCPAMTSTAVSTRIDADHTMQTKMTVNDQSTVGDKLGLSEGQKLILTVVFGVALPILTLIIVIIVYVVCRQRLRSPLDKDTPTSTSENNNQQNNIQNSRIYNKTKNCEIVIRNDCSKHIKNLNLLTNSMVREKTVSKSAPPIPKPHPLSSPDQSGFDKFNKNLNRQNHTFAFDNNFPSKETPQNCLPLRSYPRLDEGGTNQHRPAYKSVIVSLEPGSPVKSPKRHDSTIPRHDCFPPGSTDFYYVSTLSSDDSSVFSVHSNEEKLEATIV